MGVQDDAARTIDPERDDHAYFLGLLATDGSISETSRNRGRVAFELGASDASILAELADRIPYRAHLSRRRRTTNFRADYDSAILSFHDLRLRRSLAALGFRSGKTATTIGLPTQAFNEIGFWCGVVDGDGSIGLTRTNRPFASFVTASERLRDGYVDFLYRVTGRRLNPNRNTRDRVYNIVVFDEGAQQIATTLYRNGTIAIERKAMSARLIADWKRPGWKKRITFERRRWNPDQDQDVLSGTTHKEVAVKLGRTLQSVKMRHWRLRQGGPNCGDCRPAPNLNVKIM